MHGMLWRHCKFVRLQVVLQVCLLQHGVMDAKQCLLFQLKHQIANIKCWSTWFVENNQQCINISKMAEQALECKSKDRLCPLFAKPCGEMQIQKKKITFNFGSASPTFSFWMAGETDWCQLTRGFTCQQKVCGMEAYRYSKNLT